MTQARDPQGILQYELERASQYAVDRTVERVVGQTTTGRRCDIGAT